jgi:hypothetical protein
MTRHRKRHAHQASIHDKSLVVVSCFLWHRSKHVYDIGHIAIRHQMVILYTHGDLDSQCSPQRAFLVLLIARQRPILIRLCKKFRQFLLGHLLPVGRAHRVEDGDHQTRDFHVQSVDRGCHECCWTGSSSCLTGETALHSLLECCPVLLSLRSIYSICFFLEWVSARNRLEVYGLTSLIISTRPFDPSLLDDCPLKSAHISLRRNLGFLLVVSRRCCLLNVFPLVVRTHFDCRV